MHLGFGFKFRNSLIQSMRHFQGSSLHCGQSLPDCTQGWELRLRVGEETEHCRQPAATVARAKFHHMSLSKVHGLGFQSLYNTSVQLGMGVDPQD